MTLYADLEKRLRENAVFLRRLEDELIEKDLDLRVGPIRAPGIMADTDTEAADALADLSRRVEEAEKDKARLDWLDAANKRLNAHYGTSYKWQLVLNHNVARLMLGDFQVDLHDTDPNGLPSCRDAIDAVRGQRLSRDNEAEGKKG